MSPENGSRVPPSSTKPVLYFDRSARHDAARCGFGGPPVHGTGGSSGVSERVSMGAPVASSITPSMLTGRGLAVVADTSEGCPGPRTQPPPANPSVPMTTFGVRIIHTG